MAAADEVIRIAEWARRSTTARVFSDERAIRHFAHTAPLTLPPDDWQP
jgi:hypothetical protein